MSKVKIAGHASGSGTLTIQAPDTSSSRTITLPDETATLSTFDPDGAQVFNESGADVDFRVESDTNTHALFVDGASGSVGIGVTPSSWVTNGDHKAVQIGTGAAVYGRGTGDEAKAGLMANAYADATDDRFEYIGNSYASHYRQSDGNHSFWSAPSGSANGAITFTNRLEIKNDGRGLSQFTAKAWIQFDGTGTVAITDSHNVSSITDNGTGNYQVHFTNNLANAGYSVTSGDNNYGIGWNDNYAVGSFKTKRVNSSFTPIDSEKICCHIFGD